MSIKEFLQLHNPDQIKYTGYYGELIAERPFEGDRFYLYSLSSFYVEMFVELSSINESAKWIITNISNDAAIVDPYLRFIDISELISI